MKKKKLVVVEICIAVSCRFPLLLLSFTTRLLPEEIRAKNPITHIKVGLFFLPCSRNQQHQLEETSVLVLLG